MSIMNSKLIVSCGVPCEARVAICGVATRLVPAAGPAPILRRARCCTPKRVLVGVDRPGGRKSVPSEHGFLYLNAVQIDPAPVLRQIHGNALGGWPQ